MNIIDIIILFLAAFWFLKGYFKGILIEVFTLAGLIIGIIASLKLTTGLMNINGSYFVEQEYLVYILYLFVFLLVFLGILYLGKFIEKIMKVTHLNIFNRLTGGVTGVIKVLFIMSLLFWLSDQLMILPESISENSFTYIHLRNFAPGTIQFVSAMVPHLSDIIFQTEDFFSRINEHI